jgi:IS5 family transposase
MAMEARKEVTRAYCLAKKLIPEAKNDLKLRGDLLDTIQKVQRIIEQSEAVNNGNTKLADRLISFKDPDARPIVRGKLEISQVALQADNEYA